ncbi:MAG: hypothetical protein GF403_06820 [Candidatus Coatesbacteria bacterium]|nr:hypothetical protein [Candidatus Coatesbacteria bacterium]
MVLEFQLHLPVYEGPMDLLLELVQRQEVELAEVDVARVCGEFLQYVERAEVLELDLAGEFLVMAATLVQLKTRLLFPVVDGDEEAVSQAAELLVNIAEYKVYKELARALGEIEAAQLDLFPRGNPLRFARRTPKLTPDGDISALARAFGRLQPRAMDEGFLAAEKVSVAERMEEVLELLGSRERLSLAELVGDRSSREAAVVSFLALLELVKLRRIRLAQASPYLSLWVTSREDGR